jgi:hypothetical protein
MPRKKTNVLSAFERKKYLAPSPAEQGFWCRDGRVFRDLADLAHGLESMTDEIFAYHANNDKNDFAKWVADVIGDQQLAGELGRAKGRVAAAAAVQVRLTVLRQS